MDATSNTKTATLTVGNKTYDFPILSGTVGPDVIDIAKLYAQAGMFTYDPGFTSTGSCQSKITYIDGDAGILEYRGYPIEQLAEKGDFLETCYLLLYGELPTKAQKDDFDQPRDPSHHGSRADGAVLPGLPPRRPSDGDHGGGGRRAGRVLSRLHRHQRSAAAHDRLDADDREDPDAGGDGLQIHHRPALHVSEELAELRREFPAHVLRGALRGLQDQSGAGRRARQDLHPARRPRAERLDLDGADRRLLRRQSVRLHRRRHRLPVGTGPWRRQRSGAGDAGRDRHGRQDSGLHQAG